MHVHVMVLDGTFDLGLSAVLDTFGTANDLARASGKTSPPFVVRLVGVSTRARTHQGFTVALERAERGARPDAIVVPALGATMPETLGPALERREIRQAGAVLSAQAKAGTLVAAACTGTFLLAETGLLDGRAATTTWWLSPMFRDRYPRVDLDDSRMLVKSSGFVTAGAALAHLDLALFLVRRQSPALAALTARYLIIEPRRSQAAYAIPDHLAHSDPLVERFERWARRNIATRFSLAEAARAAGASERTLARRLRATLGRSPLSYVQELRVERAVHLLQTTDATVDDVAGEVGYESGVTLRTLLREKTGRGVRELRRHG